MKVRFGLLLLVCAAAVTCLFLSLRFRPRTPLAPPPGTPEVGVKPALPSATPARPSAHSDFPAHEQTTNAQAVAPPPRGLSPAAAQLIPSPESNGIAPATVLANMRVCIRQYAEMFGGNPIGTNPEIAKALNGDNPRHISFLKEDGNRLNEKGELVDPWGTPYFFHQLSAKQMEIRSAGPDRVMWTSDDLVTE